MAKWHILGCDNFISIFYSLSFIFCVTYTCTYTGTSSLLQLAHHGSAENSSPAQNGSTAPQDRLLKDCQHNVDCKGNLTHWPLGNLNEILYIFKQILVIYGWGICCEIGLIWMSPYLTNDQSTLVQVMAWCRQATSHYLSQCWPRSLSPSDVTRPQWVKCFYNNLIIWITRMLLILWLTNCDLLFQTFLEDHVDATSLLTQSSHTCPRSHRCKMVNTL